MGLLKQRRQNFGMDMSLIDGRIGREAIEVTDAFHIRDPDAGRFFDHNFKRVVIVCSVRFFQTNIFLGFHFFDLWRGAE